MKSNVNYTEFRKDFVSNKKPDARQAKIKTEDGKDGILDYFVLPLVYNLGTDDKPRYDKFSLKGPLFVTSGINKKPNKYKSHIMDYTILISFKQDNPEHMKFLEVFDQVYFTCAELVKKAEVELGIAKKRFDPKSPYSTFTYPIYEPEDKNKNKSFFLKFYKRGPYHTLMTGRDKKEIEWDKLINTSLEGYPIITFNWVHIGGEFILSTECKEFIIFDANERKIETSEAEAIDKMNAEDPDKAKDVISKLEQIMAAYQEVQPPLPPSSKEEMKKEHEEAVEVKEENNLLSGINPTDDQPTSSLPTALKEAVNAAPKKRQFKIPHVDN